MDKGNMIILLDNGHGRETPGKRSPDGRLREWEYARRIAAGIEAELLSRGYDAQRVVEEDGDVPLSERCRRVNKICGSVGAGHVVLVSVHCNAAGNGREWANARGWGAYVGLNASAGSKQLARRLVEAAELHGQKVRRYSPDSPWWPQDLAICRDTQCAAVLTENLFMDNREDVEYLLSETGKQAIVDLHVNGIIEYINSATK